MLLAESGQRAGSSGSLDPVGAGASKLRTETANQLLKKSGLPYPREHFEIKTLALKMGRRRRGCRSGRPGDEGKSGQAAAFAKALPENGDAVAAITGASTLWRMRRR